MAWEACRVVPHRRRDSSCHTQEAGVVLSHRWHMATGDKEGMAVTVSLRNYGGEQRSVGGRPMVLVTVSTFLVFLGALG